MTHSVAPLTVEGRPRLLKAFVEVGDTSQDAFVEVGDTSQDLIPVGIESDQGLWVIAVRQWPVI
ncbi:hypothetical protein [Rhodococcus sp. NPDC060176]|uniref:hypothetical protein n=1 Tax=Rhodococcus sp. NPDC060176 TaxID=3347062 RepID=UPI003667889B